MVVSSPQSNWYVRAGSLSQLSFRGWAWPGRLILLLNHTLRNIMRIIGPWDRGSQPRIQRELEGRQVFATEFSRVDTACPAHIIVETYFREWNGSFRSRKKRQTSRVHVLLKKKTAFSWLSFRGWVPSGWLILLLKENSMKIMGI